MVKRWVRMNRNSYGHACRRSEVGVRAFGFDDIGHRGTLFFLFLLLPIRTWFSVWNHAAQSFHGGTSRTIISFTPEPEQNSPDTLHFTANPTQRKQLASMSERMDRSSDAAAAGDDQDQQQQQQQQQQAPQYYTTRRQSPTGGRRLPKRKTPLGQLPDSLDEVNLTTTDHGAANILRLSKVVLCVVGTLAWTERLGTYLIVAILICLWLRLAHAV